MIGQMIAVLFLARDLAHREHLRTRSYAQHMALGEFYPSIVELADKLAEAYQGKKGIIEEIPLLENEFTGGIDDMLEQQHEWIEKNRTKAVGDDSCLLNIIDEILGQYLSTLYKLRNLS